MKTLLVVAALAAAAAQDGTRGNFCPNYLGSKRALLDGYTGYGMLMLSQAMPLPTTFADGMIITTFASEEDPSRVMKLTSCIYDVSVRFETGQAEIRTGAPGVPMDQQRCWVVSKEGDQFQVRVYKSDGAGKSPCPGVNTNATAVTGPSTLTISSFTEQVPHHAGPAVHVQRMAGPAGEAVAALDGLVVTGNSMWMNNETIGMTMPLGMMFGDAAGEILGTQVVQMGFVGVAGFDAPTLTGKFLYSLPPGAPVPAVCILARLDPTSGIATVQQPPSDGSTTGLGEDGCPTVFIREAAVTYSIAIQKAPAIIQAVLDQALKTKGVVLANSTGMKSQTRPVVNTEVTLTGTLPASVTSNPASVVDPCNVVLLRTAMAERTGAALVDVKLTAVTVTIGAQVVTFTLASDGPANLITGACAPASSSTGPRTLRQEARLLQASGSIAASVQVVATVQTQASIAQAVTAAQGSPSSLASSFAAAVAPGAAAAVSPPQQSTAQVVAAPAPFKRSVVYTPNADIKQFHSIPRFTVVGNEKPTNKFALDVTYMQGALGPAGGIIAFGVIFFVVYILTYMFAQCCKCCSRCRPKRDPATYYTGCRKNCGAPRALVVFALINAGLLLAGIAYTGRFAAGIDKVFKSADDMSLVLSSTASLMKSGNGGANPVSYRDLNGVQVTGVTSMYKAALDAKAAAVDLKTQMTLNSVPRVAANLNTAQYDPPSVVVTIVDTLANNLQDAATTADSISSTLGDVGITLKDALTKVPVEQMKSYSTLAGYIILAVLAGIVLLWSMFVCQNSFAACVYKVSAPLVILLVLLVTILAGAYYAIGVVGADICVAPADTILSVLPSGSSMPELTYFLKCAEDPTLLPTGSLAQVQTAVDQIGLAAQQVTSLSQQVDDDRSGTTPSDVFMTLWKPTPGTTTGPTYLTTAATGMTAAKTAVTAIAETQVSCAAIDPIVQTLFTGLCNDGFGTVIALCRILIAASVMLIIHLGIGADVCMYHPGDANVWGPKEEGKAVEQGLELRDVAMPPSPASATPVVGHAPVIGGSKV